MSDAPTLTDEVRALPIVGHDKARLLARLRIRRAMDLLFHFPRGYEMPADVTQPDDFADNQRLAFTGQIEEIDERVTQTGKHMLGAKVRVPDQTFVRLLWFNQPFRKQELWPGRWVVATGRIRSTGLHWEMVQPQVQWIEEGELPATRLPLPIYPLTEGLKQFQLRQIVRELLPSYAPLVQEVLPDDMRQRLEVPDITAALQQIHFPANEEEAEQARRRFKLQELLVLQLAISLQRTERESAAAAPVFEPSGKIHSRILNRLPHELTQDQLQAVQEIGQDMGRSQPMNRLLQGDVGSGKTLVAQYAMLLCVAHGYQAVLMAPTEVLAQQHAQTLESSLASSRVRTALLTGSLSRPTRREVLERISIHEVDLVIGTQALLSEDVEFKQLGLVIVDEQHKFGVLQRAQLRTDDSQPHYLVLSATPIPRTIAMTAFGDLDVSVIRQKPPGRAPVHSYVIQADETRGWWKFVEAQIAEGRQAFVIAPRVESAPNGDSLNGDIASAEGVYESLRNGAFSDRRLGLLHGRMDGAEKERVLRQFASGEIDLLVATTVVEVGIDVPNATVMTILDANRLGLSQLHQLRGRVSRGSTPGFACAVASASEGSDPAKTTDNERLAAFAKSDDGFELAEMDLQLRGPGDLLGTVQSGLPPLKIANLATDAELLELARDVARDLLASDPTLADPALALLRKQTLKRYGKFMQLSDVG